MKAEDIEHRDFLVGMRGYDKDDVRAFLAEVAAEHAALQAELEARRNVPATAAAPVVQDDFENLGASVAAILRAAKESTTELSAEAGAKAAAVRAQADDYAASLRAQADELRAVAQSEAGETRSRAVADADELRAAAQRSLDEARAEAEQIVRTATQRAQAIEIETEARINIKIDEAAAREVALRARLLEANDELQLALMALDGATTDVVAAQGPEAVDLPTEEHAEPGAQSEHEPAEETPAWS